MSDQAIEHNISHKGIMKNTMRVYIAAFATAPLQYILRIIVAGNLPLEQVGMYYSLLGIVWIVAVYNDLWFKEAIGYFYPKYLAEKEYNKSKTLLFFTLWFQLITSLILAALLYYFSWLIAFYYLDDISATFVVKIFWLYLLCYIIYNFIDWLFLVFQDGFWNKLISLLNYILLIGIAALVPYGLFEFMGVKSNLTGFVLAQILPSAIGIVIATVVIWRKYRGVAFRGGFERDWAEYKKVQLYSLWVLFTNNLVFLIGQIDLQFTTFLFWTKEAGLYSYGMMLTNLLVTLLSPIGAMLYPLISHLKSRQQDKTLEFLLKGALNYLGTIAAVGSLFLFTYSGHIASFLFGQEYWEAGEIVRWNLPFVFFGLISGLLFMVYAGMGLVKKRIKVLLWAFIINIVCNFALSTLLGVHGVALTVGLTWMMMFLFSYWDLQKHGAPVAMDRKFIGYNLIVAFVALFWLYELFPLDLSTRLQVGLSIGYAGMMFAAILVLANLGRLKDIIRFGKQMIGQV